MRMYFEHLFKTPMFVLFLIVSIFYGLPALGKPAKINEYAIVTAIGIDSIEEEENNYEISLLTFIPIADQSFKEYYKVISSKGRNISEAMDFAGLHIGRQVGLSHVKLVVLSDDLTSGDITTYLDYLARNPNIDADTHLIVTDGSAKDFLNAAQSLDSESSTKVTEVVMFNSDYIFSAESTFETFYKGLLGPTKVSLVPFLELERGDQDGLMVMLDSSVAQDGGGSGGTQDGGGNSQSKSAQEIVNNGDTCIFKSGKKIAQIDGKDMKKVSFVLGDFDTGSVEIYDYSDENYQNANLTFEVLGQQIRYKINFQNGIPIVFINLTLNLTLSEVDNGDGLVQENISFTSIPNSMCDAIEEKVRASMCDAIEIMRDNKADVVDFYTKIHNTDGKAFQKFLDTLEEEDDYLNHIIFKASVRVVSK